MEAGDKYLNLHIQQNLEHSGNFKKKAKGRNCSPLGASKWNVESEEEEKPSISADWGDF